MYTICIHMFENVNIYICLLTHGTYLITKKNK